MADRLHASVLVSGEVSGPVVCLDEPLSFWGGFDADTGTIIGRHPGAGTSLVGRVVVMPSGRGSSSSSSVLAEAIRTGTAPAAIVLEEPDEIVALGALVAAELYAIRCPVLVLPGAVESLATGEVVAVDADGFVERLGA